MADVAMEREGQSRWWVGWRLLMLVVVCCCVFCVLARGRVAYFAKFVE
jgi:hypothetical protein